MGYKYVREGIMWYFFETLDGRGRVLCEKPIQPNLRNKALVSERERLLACLLEMGYDTQF